MTMARRCKAANLTFVLDLHYSDWWADPGKQRKPLAWDALSFKDLTAAVELFTQKTIAALVTDLQKIEPLGFRPARPRCSSDSGAL
jgi:arabinogalactan endo-1,4-beta-galactosidase